MTVEQTLKVIRCKFCQGEAVVRFGSYKGIPRYWCKSCRRKFAGNDALPGRKIPPERVGAAVAMYYKGLSYKDIQEQMGQMYGRAPSKSTLYAWVTQYSKLAGEQLDRQRIPTGTTWVADEMVLRIDGKNVWLFDIMDAKSRYFLASYVTPNRTIGDVQVVFRQALERAEKPPRFIVTDRLKAYPEGIESIFGAEARHVQSGGIRAKINNNLVERLQGTVRERTKVMRGLQNRETAQAFLDGWRVDYNYFRPHESLGNRTPASVLGIESPLKDWGQVARLEDKTLRTDTALKAEPSYLRDRTFRVRRGGI
ncbi:MAG: IS6 family transposase [Chloroflexi bacterium]|nr:IS6 family transposase [Chloroflexota bacterium]